MITQEYLKSIFEYDGHDLRWSVTRGLARAGSIAGTINSRGYRHIRIDNKFYQSHRLIWIFIYGKLPDGMVVDHINRDRTDNRVDNLRLLSNSANNRNSIRSDHEDVGVWKTGNRFKATYNLDGKRHYIGTFASKEEAIKKRAEYIEMIA